MTHALALKKGTQIDGYEVVELLGRGGMGAVYRVRRGDAEFALKTLAVAAGSEEDLQEEIARFKREAELLASLRHPGIVRVNTAGHKPGFFYFVMRLVEGESLDGRLRRTGPLPPDEAVDLILDIAEAIEHAHAKGIVHRDLKPANVLVDHETGRPLVTDFGLARRLGESDADRLTKTGEIMGTPAYVAPEQALGLKQELDEKTDVYGLGALLYALLAGQAPFAGPSALAIMKDVTTRPPPPLKDVPPELEAFVLRAMAKERSERPPTASAFIEELETLYGRRSLLSRGAWILLGGTVAISVLGVLALSAGLLEGSLKKKGDGTVPTGSAAVATPSSPSTFKLPPDPQAELTNAYGLAFVATTSRARARALLDLVSKPLPAKKEVRRRAAAFLLEDAVSSNEELKEKLQEEGILSLLVGESRGKRLDSLERIFRSFARARELDPELDLMPDKLRFSFLLIAAASRNKAYDALRGDNWTKRWVDAFDRCPNHPTAIFIHACAKPDSEEAREDARRALDILEKVTPRPHTRVLAFDFALDVAGPDQELVKGLLRYARYTDEREHPDHDFARRVPETNLEPVPPELMDFTRLLGWPDFLKK